MGALPPMMASTSIDGTQSATSAAAASTTTAATTDGMPGAVAAVPGGDDNDGAHTDEQLLAASFEDNFESAEVVELRKQIEDCEALIADLVLKKEGAANRIQLQQLERRLTTANAELETLRVKLEAALTLS